MGDDVVSVPDGASADGFVLDAADRALAVLLSTERGRQDPYPYYAQLRATPGLHRSAMGSFVATRYGDCEAVLKDRRFGHPPAATVADTTPEHGEALRHRYPRIADRAPVMLELNPPAHTRLRRLVAKAFTPRVIANLRPTIATVVDQLLQDCTVHTDSFDVVPDIGVRLPALVISGLLGLPRDGHEHVIPHVRRIIQAFDTPLPKTENLEEIYRATEAVEEYFTAIIDAKRVQPGDDLISNLVAVRDAQGRLSEAELVSTLLLLFVAGYESSTNLVANGFHALMSHPDAVEQLRAAPAGIPLAVEEMLRWEAPVQLVGRVALEEVEVGEQRVRAGEQVLLFLGAANRDPERYTEPDRFVVNRDEGPPLSFSIGIHYCLGAPLARLEAEVLFGALLERWPQLEPVSAPIRFRSNLVLRGVESLRVSVRSP